VTIQHVVVDGSNIATEGREMPSLAQLEEAVAALRREYPDAEVTVVVDATFAHRIEPAELAAFEQAALQGAYVYPPAGAIGRGDAFLLRIAEKVDATVLSNDSFQEFHGEHPWLFERGRLLGATPVAGIGWIFVPRTPVRGPRSRVAVSEAKRAKAEVERAIRAATEEAAPPEATASPGRRGRRRARGRVEEVADEPEEEASGLAESHPRPSPQAVNDPLTFISFVAEHRLGAVVDASVESFTSHGAVVRAGEMRCYVPLACLGDPPPRSAREVLTRGEVRSFVLTALDPQRRGVELALPEVAVISGKPREETVAAELAMTRPPRRRSSRGRDTAPAAEPARGAPTPEPARPTGAGRGDDSAPEAPTRTRKLQPSGAASADPAAGAAGTAGRGGRARAGARRRGDTKPAREDAVTAASSAGSDTGAETAAPGRSSRRRSGTVGAPETTRGGPRRAAGESVGLSREPVGREDPSAPSVTEVAPRARRARAARTPRTGAPPDGESHPGDLAGGEPAGDAGPRVLRRGEALGEERSFVPARVIRARKTSRVLEVARALKGRTARPSK